MDPECAGPLLPLLRPPPRNVYPYGLCGCPRGAMDRFARRRAQAREHLLRPPHRLTRCSRGRRCPANRHVLPWPAAQRPAHVPGRFERRPSLRSRHRGPGSFLLPRLPTWRRPLRGRAHGRPSRQRRLDAIARRHPALRGRPDTYSTHAPCGRAEGRRDARSVLQPGRGLSGTHSRLPYRPGGRLADLAAR